MKNILKILIGAILTSVSAVLIYYGLFELELQLLTYASVATWIAYFVMGLDLLMPIVIIVVSCIVYLISKKQRYLRTSHCISMLLIADLLFAIMELFSVNIYSGRLGFELGLGYVLGLLISFGVDGIWALILIGLLIYECKKKH